MKLFAELHLDEDVSALMATLLRARGFAVLTAHEAGMLAQDDPAQLSYAVQLERCIVTHNRVHFERLHAGYLRSGREHCGIIVAARRNHYELARRLGVLLNSLTADEIRNQLLYI